MRPIDADKLMELYENTPELDMDIFSVPVPVIRQNILDIPTVNPYEWISVEEKLPEAEKALIRHDGHIGLCSIRVLCACRQKSGKILLKRDITKNGIFRQNHIGEYLEA